MNAGTLLKVLRDVIDDLEQDGILRPDGSFLWPADVQADVHVVDQVNASLLAHGVTEPAEIQKVLNALPLVLSLTGV